MCDVPSGARRRASGPGGLVLALHKLGSCPGTTRKCLHMTEAPPPKHLPHDPTLRSRLSVWYQRTDYLCYYTGALLLLLKVYQSSRGRRRSPYIFSLPTRRHRRQCVIVSWSADEAGQYLTAYRQSERRMLTLIYESLNVAPDALLRTTLTGIPRANRTDAETLRASFGSSTKIAQADTCLLVFGSSGRRTRSRGRHVPTVGHELDKVAVLPAKDEIVQCVVGQRHRACAGVKRQWD
ncbi:hypothetical protein EDB89DRAFT_2102511 [Lactarius sanguifluus]|nr:hypothetical protein EDB89DRAFT_2102511 [Lactarius sanguifluus]